VTKENNDNKYSIPADEARKENFYDEVEEMTPDEINQMLSNNKLV